MHVKVAGQSDFSNTPIVDDGIGHTSRAYDVHPKSGIFIDVLGMKGCVKDINL
jgi:hypothetical protein